MFDVKNISDGISLLGTVVSTVKSCIDILPKGEKEDASNKIFEVEKKLKMAEIQIAQGLGYELCKCTWPPKIMLYAGDAEYGEKFRCTTCGRITSPDDMPPLNNNFHII